MAKPKTTKRPLLIALLLCLITGAVFHDVLTAGFVGWDDNLHVYENPCLHPASWSHLGQLWSAPYGHLYIPISYTLYWLLAHAAHLPAPLQSSEGYSLDLNPQIFHAANLLLHMINVLLVYTLLRRLLPGINTSVRDWAAGAGALLFAIHPVQVESVAWISEMRGLLSGMLSLLALLCYLRSSQRDRGRLWYCLATVFFALALLAKPSAIAVPMLAALLDSLILGRPWRIWLRALAPWGILCVALITLTRGAQPVTMEIVTPLWSRPLIAGDSLTFALSKLLWPSHLGIDYGRNPVWLMSHRWAFLSGLPACGVIVLACAGRRRFPGIAAAVGLFFAALLPTLGLTPFAFQIYSTTADRYLYLALLGPALGLAWGLERLWSVGEEKARLRLYASVSCGTALFLCALGSNVQTLCWQNSNALFQQALAVNPRSWGAANDFGAVLLEQGHPQLALNLLATAVRERPDFAEAHANLGVAHIRLSQFGPAEKEFREAVRCDPTLPAAWNGLGASLLNQGHANDAAAAFQHALSLQPGSPIAQNNLRLAQAQLTAR